MNQTSDKENLRLAVQLLGEATARINQVEELLNEVRKTKIEKKEDILKKSIQEFIDQGSFRKSHHFWVAMRTEHATTINDLIKLKRSDLLKFNGVGKTTLQEIENELGKYGLSLTRE